MSIDSEVMWVADVHSVQEVRRAIRNEQAFAMQPNGQGLLMVVPGVMGTPQVPFAG
jgi:hypothetical protein